MNVWDASEASGQPFADVSPAIETTAPRIRPSQHIVGFLARDLSHDTHVNVMDQYYPAWKAKTEAKYTEINRRTDEAELDAAFGYARDAGHWQPHVT